MAPALITKAVASTLNLDGLATGIRTADSAYRGAYAAFGIFRYFAEKRLTAEKSKKPITTWLREKCGLSAGTISHTAYAAKVFQFVMTDHLTEAEFNALPASTMQNLILVMGENSQRRLLVKDAVTLLRDCLGKGEDPGDEFGSLYAHGLTVNEAAKKADEVAKAEKQQQAADQQAEIEKLATAKADKLAADAEAKRGADAAKAGGASTPIAPNGATTTTPAANAAAPGAAPTNVVAGPGAGQKAPTAKPTATELGEQLDKLLLQVGQADPKTQLAFFAGPWKAADALLASMLAPKTSPKKAA